MLLSIHTAINHTAHLIYQCILDKPFIAEIIENLRSVFQQLQFEFNLSMSLKIHVIVDHYMDFFEAKNETLLSYTDEFCESMHSQIRLFEESHRYLNIIK